MASLAYVGGIQNKTIYEESTVTETISYTNYEEFFDVAFSASSTSAAFISAGDNNEFIITVKPRNSSSTYNTCVLTAVGDITSPFNLYCTAVCRGNYTIYYVVKPDGTQSTIKLSGDTTIAIDGIANGEQIIIKAITSASDTSTIIQSIQVQMDAQKTFTTKIPIGTQSVNVNKPVSSIYAGVTATVPVYTETTTTEDVALSTSTFTDFFSADNTGTTGTNAKGITWADNSGGGLRLTFGNYGIHSSTSMTTFTAQRDLTNIVIKSLYYTETSYDKITLTVAGTTVLNAVSGTSSTLTQQWTGSLSKGQTIVLKFVKDSSASASNESSTYFTLSCDPYQKTTVDKVQTGTETKLTDRKIVKGYIGGPNGKARLFFGGSKFSYTGEYTTSDVTVDGVACTLYTLTGSGTLNIGVDNAQYWICGGGAGGAAGKIDAAPSTSGTSSYGNVGGGNGGGGGFTASGTLSTGSYAVLIGAGGTTDTGGSETSIATYSAGGGGADGNGGSGGGACGYAGYIDYSIKHINGTAGTGDGLSKYPFGLESLNAHCAGGGGGCIWYYYYTNSSNIDNLRYTGGAGGSNGANGGREKSDSVGGGSGGTYGGGTGATYNVMSGLGTGGDASYYGSGGGGGGSYRYKQGASTDNTDVSNGGNGYQGVAYVLVPA